MSGPVIEQVVGVDFSGAKLAGRNTWVARCSVTSPGRSGAEDAKRRTAAAAKAIATELRQRPHPDPLPAGEGKRLKLLEIAPLESLAGSADRAAALAWLVDAIRASRRTLWAIDFPFGLPIELGWQTWPEQLGAVLQWTGTVNAFGLECCRRSMAAVGKLHTRRVTDIETRTPFDCYHYRIVYQMFHGMRDLLAPLAGDESTAILPYQVERLTRADRAVVEACPGSTLRRRGLPFNRYKQTGAGPFDRGKRAVRKTILDALGDDIETSAEQARQVLHNRGGDALDAVLAAVGAWQAWRSTSTDAIASHPRYRHEGFVFA